MKKQKIKIGNANLLVAVAKNKEEHRKGLMGVSSLPRNHGMLFVFPKEQKANFWMKNTTIPLSIAFIGKDNKIQEILNLNPLDETGVESKNQVLYALEVNQGWFLANNISVGDKIDYKIRRFKLTIS